MLKLDRHLSEDELLALRDQRDDDFTRRDHLQECPRCQKRFAFLSAFKSALKDVVEEESSPRVRLSSIRRTGRRRASLPEVPSYRRRTSNPGITSRSRDLEPTSLADYSSAPAPDCPPDSLRTPIIRPVPPPGPHPEPETLAAYFDGALEEYERTRVHKHLVDCERCMADLLVLFPSKEGAARGGDPRGESVLPETTVGGRLPSRFPADHAPATRAAASRMAPGPLCSSASWDAREVPGGWAPATTTSNRGSR